MKLEVLESFMTTEAANHSLVSCLLRCAINGVQSRNDNKDDDNNNRNENWIDLEMIIV